ncbi:hypothetical protein EDC96DRAFT_431083, partial [Choanephora cucurbitarum]
FWSLSLHFLPRNLAFRKLQHLLPSCDRLTLMGVVNSGQCRLCSAPPDSAFHSSVGCPIRWSIWTELLTAYFPFHVLPPSTIYDAILLRKFPSLPSIPQHHFLIVILTGRWTIWRAYWRLHFEAIQVIPEHVVNQAI